MDSRLNLARPARSPWRRLPGFSAGTRRAARLWSLIGIALILAAVALVLVRPRLLSRSSLDDDDPDSASITSTRNNDSSFTLSSSSSSSSSSSNTTTLARGGKCQGWCRTMSNMFPDLPGYQPWTHPSNGSDAAAEKDDCEMFWGNGYVHLHNLFGSPPSGYHRPSSSDEPLWKPKGNFPSPSSSSSLAANGWLRCFHNSFLPSSICEAAALVLHPSRVRMSEGDEEIEAVRWREEHAEYPAFDAGALELVVSASVDGGGTQGRGGGDKGEGEGNEGPATEGQVTGGEMISKGSTGGSASILRSSVDNLIAGDGHLRNMLNSVRTASSASCAYVVNEPTLVVIRYEYVNIYHTMTDWYNVYHSIKVTGIQTRPRVIFVDGHAKGNLDPVWAQLFGPYRFLKSFKRGSICLSHAIIVPLGYHSAVFRAYTGRAGSPGQTRGHDAHFFRMCFPPPGLSTVPVGEGGWGLGSWGHTELGKKDEKGRQRVSEFGEFVSRSYGLGVTDPPWSQRPWEQGCAAIDFTAAAASAPASEQGKGAGGGNGSVFTQVVPHAPAALTQQQNRKLLQQQQDQQWQQKQNQRPVRLLLIRRDPYLAHPRQRGVDSRGLGSESSEQLVRHLRTWALQLGAPEQQEASEQADRAAVSRSWMEAEAEGVGGGVLRKAGVRNVNGMLDNGGQNDKADGELWYDPQASEANGGATVVVDGVAVGAGDSTIEKAAAEWLQPGTRTHPPIFVLNGTMTEWSVARQVEAIYWSDVLVGAHGAGLTQVIFARPNTALIEIRPASDSRDHYELLANLRGIMYHRIEPSSPAELAKVIAKLMEAEVMPKLRPKASTQQVAHRKLQKL